MILQSLPSASPVQGALECPFPVKKNVCGYRCAHKPRGLSGGFSARRPPHGESALYSARCRWTCICSISLSPILSVSTALSVCGGGTANALQPAFRRRGARPRCASLLALGERSLQCSDLTANSLQD